MNPPLLTPTASRGHLGEVAVGRTGQMAEGAMPTYAVDPIRAHAKSR